MSNISRFIGNERGDKICHEDDGCPTELAVLKRFWREQQASTLPEEVANLVELLDEEEVPYEDSLGVALSLTGRTKQYANGKTATLREQVEKLTKERDELHRAFNQPVPRSEWEKMQEQLAALAEQNAKMREALIAISIAWSSNEIYSQHFFNEALSLPDLATPVLNRILAEGMRMAGDFVESPIGRKLESLNDGPRQLAEGIRARADELEKNDAL